MIHIVIDRETHSNVAVADNLKEARVKTYETVSELVDWEDFDNDFYQYYEVEVWHGGKLVDTYPI